jgi:regulator of replication initiation timing
MNKYFKYLNDSNARYKTEDDDLELDVDRIDVEEYKTNENINKLKETIKDLTEQNKRLKEENESLRDELLKHIKLIKPIENQEPDKLDPYREF